MKKPKMKINLANQVDVDNENQTDEQIKKEQYIWYLLLTLLDNL